LSVGAGAAIDTAFDDEYTLTDGAIDFALGSLTCGAGTLLKNATKAGVKGIQLSRAGVQLSARAAIATGLAAEVGIVGAGEMTRSFIDQQELNPGRAFVSGAVSGAIGYGVPVVGGRGTKWWRGRGGEAATEAVVAIPDSRAITLYDPEVAAARMDPIEIEFRVSERATRNMSPDDRAAFVHHLQEQEDVLNWMSLLHTEDFKIMLQHYKYLKDTGVVDATRRQGSKRFGLKGTGLHAAHALDSIAGGYTHYIIGGRNAVQSTIGSLWRTNRNLIVPGRRHRLRAIFTE